MAATFVGSSNTTVFLADERWRGVLEEEEVPMLGGGGGGNFSKDGEGEREELLERSREGDDRERGGMKGAWLIEKK